MRNSKLFDFFLFKKNAHRILINTIIHSKIFYGNIYEIKLIHVYVIVLNIRVQIN